MTRRHATTRVGFQLYSLHGSEDPLPDIVRRVGDQGYQGVEFADRLHEADADAVATALAEAGVEPVAAHVSLSRLKSDREALLDRLATIECSRLVVPHVGSGNFLTRTRVDDLATRLDRIGDALADHGVTLSVHTTSAMHRPLLDRYGLDSLVGMDAVPAGVWRYAVRALGGVTPDRMHGETGFERLCSRTDALSFEVDTKEAAIAGRDLTAVLDRAGDRTWALHLSDAVRTRRFPPAFRPSGLGDGVVDLDASLAAALDRGVEWVIVESEDPAEPLAETTAEFERLLARFDDDTAEDGRDRRAALGFGRPSA